MADIIRDHYAELDQIAGSFRDEAEPKLSRLRISATAPPHTVRGTFCGAKPALLENWRKDRVGRAQERSRASKESPSSGVRR